MSQAAKTANPPKKLLMLSYCFPPAWEVGKFRVAKFVKYLRREGIEPAVVTIRRSFANGGDRSLDADVRDARRLELKTWPKPSPLLWIIALLIRLPGILRKEKPDVLFGTGSPFLPLICLPLVKSLTGLPYIVDLRDPWALHPQYRRTTGRIRNWVRRRLESWVVRGADHVLVVTETMRCMYSRHYASQADKFVLISNGFDPEDAGRLASTGDTPPANSAGSARRPVLVYAGKFASIRSPQPLLEALQLRPDLAARLEIRLIGAPEPQIERLVQASGLGHVVRLVGQYAYEQTLAEIREADAGLIFGTYEAWEPTTKIYDYMMLRRPVFAMTCEQGEVATTLRNYGAGVVCPHRGAALANALQDFLDKLDAWQQRAADADPSAYDRRAGAQRLAALIHCRHAA